MFNYYFFVLFNLINVCFYMNIFLATNQKFWRSTREEKGKLDQLSVNK